MQDYQEIERVMRSACSVFQTARMTECEWFRKLHKGTNIMTPDRIGVYRRNHGDIVVEITYGRGIAQETIYGVTIIERSDYIHETYIRRVDLNRMFYQPHEVVEYITAL